MSHIEGMPLLFVAGFVTTDSPISDGEVGDQAASCVYSLTTPILCAKSVPRADAVGVPPLRAPNLQEPDRAQIQHTPREAFAICEL